MFKFGQWTYVRSGNIWVVCCNTWAVKFFEQQKWFWRMEMLVQWKYFELYDGNIWTSVKTKSCNWHLVRSLSQLHWLLFQKLRPSIKYFLTCDLYVSWSIPWAVVIPWFPVTTAFGSYFKRFSLSLNLHFLLHIWLVGKFRGLSWIEPKELSGAMWDHHWSWLSEKSLVILSLQHTSSHKEVFQVSL